MSVDINDNICWEYHNAESQLAKLPPAITFFGSARIREHESEYRFAEQLAKRLSDAGFAILSGGGPGIMEAANKGAFAGKSPAIGLNIVLPHEQKANPYQDLSITFEHFAPRKTMLVKHAFAFVVMTGGFGTLDELFEALTLMQTRKIPPRPVILVGSAFWGKLLDWLKNELATRQLINRDDFDFIYLMDNENEIYQTIVDYYARQIVPIKAA